MTVPRKAESYMSYLDDINAFHVKKDMNYIRILFNNLLLLIKSR